MIKQFFALLTALIVAILSLTGCGGFGEPPTSTDPTTSVKHEIEASTGIYDDFTHSTTSVTTITTSESTTQNYNTDWSLSDIPPFSGNPYITINNNIPSFKPEDYTTISFEYYSPLDSLGRCGTTYACIGQDIMPTEERGEIGQVKPTGWHTVKYDCVDGKYLYNRCHLIGFQLTGENANTRNLITGTRYMNVDGMLPFENEIADYVDDTNNHVLYRVTPIFEGNNLVANGVQMEAYSVEDNGDGVCFNVYCYNAQPGVTIDYKTGESWLSNDIITTTFSSGETTKEEYILNTNSKKFHLPDCSSVKSMSDKNKREYYGSKEDLISDGYSPCGYCKP